MRKIKELSAHIITETLRWTKNYKWIKKGTVRDIHKEDKPTISAISLEYYFFFFSCRFSRTASRGRSSGPSTDLASLLLLPLPASRVLCWWDLRRPHCLSVPSNARGCRAALERHDCCDLCGRLLSRSWCQSRSRRPRRRWLLCWLSWTCFFRRTFPPQ